MQFRIHYSFRACVYFTIIFIAICSFDWKRPRPSLFPVYVCEREWAHHWRRWCDIKGLIRVQTFFYTPALLLYCKLLTLIFQTLEPLSLMMMMMMNNFSFLLKLPMFIPFGPLSNCRLPPLNGSMCACEPGKKPSVNVSLKSGGWCNDLFDISSSNLVLADWNSLNNHRNDDDDESMSCTSS